MHENSLTEKGKTLFPALPRFDNFYLVGGTALALQIGHRVSVDFDLFSEQELSSGLFSKIKRVFKDLSIITTYSSSEQINVSIDGVSFTFLAYPYPVIEPLKEYRGVKVASVAEIAAMKSFAIGKRLAYKDYVDWYFMLKGGHVNLQQVFEISENKFGGAFNDRLFLSQLASFEDIQTTKIDFLGEEVPREEIRKFLEQEVKKVF